jgi:hypothetical protein
MATRGDDLQKGQLYGWQIHRVSFVLLIGGCAIGQKPTGTVNVPDKL